MAAKAQCDEEVTTLPLLERANKFMRQTAPQRASVLASRVLRDGLCHDRDALVHHTSEVFSALCFDHLVSGPALCLHRGMFTESTTMMSLC